MCIRDRCSASPTNLTKLIGKETETGKYVFQAATLYTHHKRPLKVISDRIAATDAVWNPRKTRVQCSGAASDTNLRAPFELWRRAVGPKSAREPEAWTHEGWIQRPRQRFPKTLYAQKIIAFICHLLRGIYFGNLASDWLRAPPKIFRSHEFSPHFCVTVCVLPQI